MPGRRRALRENVQRLLAFGLAARAQRLTKKDLGAEIMTSTFENSGVLGIFAGIEAIDAPSGEDPRQSRHVILGVAATDAQRVQLHQFAREILVEPNLVVPPGRARR